jgi:hypothetical protein
MLFPEVSLWRGGMPIPMGLLYYSYSANASTRGIIPHTISHIYGTQTTSWIHLSWLVSVIDTLSIHSIYIWYSHRDVLAIEFGTYVLTPFTGLYDKPVRKVFTPKGRKKGDGPQVTTKWDWLSYGCTTWVGASNKVAWIGPIKWILYRMKHTLSDRFSMIAGWWFNRSR